MRRLKKILYFCFSTSKIFRFSANDLSIVYSTHVSGLSSKKKYPNVEQVQTGILLKSLPNLPLALIKFDLFCKPKDIKYLNNQKINEQSFKLKQKLC